MTDDHRLDEPLRLGGIEFRDRSSARASGGAARSGSARSASNGRGSAGSGSAGSGSDRGASPGNGRDGNSSNGGGSRGNDRTGNGSDGGASPGNGRDENGSNGGDPGARAVADSKYVPPDVLESLHKQVADFADFAHRERSKLPDELTALGSGGGITAQVVRKVAAEVIRVNLAPWLGADEQALTYSLMLSLVAPSDMVELSDSQRASFVLTRGQLMIDVSTAELGREKPETRLVAPPSRQVPGEMAADGGVASAATARGAESPRPAAVVFVGAAAVATRPYVSLDRLMTKARRAIFEQVSSAGDAQNAGSGLKAASNLEIVVLLEKALGGGLWIDVNPKTRLPTAALAIDFKRPPERGRFTHVLLRERADQEMLTADSATG